MHPGIKRGFSIAALGAVAVMTARIRRSRERAQHS
jgi:hypothetical protein